MTVGEGRDLVLVHGAFRGPWAWDRVRPRLEDAGHRVHTPDVGGPQATLDSCIAAIIEVFERRNLRNGVLVGHSQGGFFARAASQHLSDRISALVHLDAPVPAHGDTAFDFRPPGTPRPTVARGEKVPPRPVHPGAGMSEADAAWINERLVAQAVAPSLDPVVLDEPAALALPEHHVFFSNTPEAYPCVVTRRRLDEQGGTYRVIEAPHDAIVTHPDEVAATVVEIVALLPR